MGFLWLRIPNRQYKGDRDLWPSPPRRAAEAGTEAQEGGPWLPVFEGSPVGQVEYGTLRNCSKEQWRLTQQLLLRDLDTELEEP